MKASVWYGSIDYDDEDHFVQELVIKKVFIFRFACRWRTMLPDPLVYTRYLQHRIWTFARKMTSFRFLKKVFVL